MTSRLHHILKILKWETSNQLYTEFNAQFLKPHERLAKLSCIIKFRLLYMNGVVQCACEVLESQDQLFGVA